MSNSVLSIRRGVIFVYIKGKLRNLILKKVYLYN